MCVVTDPKQKQYEKIKLPITIMKIRKIYAVILGNDRYRSCGAVCRRLPGENTVVTLGVILPKPRYGRPK